MHWGLPDWLGGYGSMSPSFGQWFSVWIMTPEGRQITARDLEFGECSEVRLKRLTQSHEGRSGTRPSLCYCVPLGGLATRRT
ncbi:hypothetical protein OKW35_003503 [Paraburkholderia sp. MM5477-R1]